MPAGTSIAFQLIQQAYAPPTVSTTPEGLRRYQQELFEIQKRPEAWGLVIPLLEHQDQNVQFFGAHTAQVKIARDWCVISLRDISNSLREWLRDSFPTEHVESLRDLLLQLTAHAVAIGRSKFILRKLFVAVRTHVTRFRCLSSSFSSHLWLSNLSLAARRVGPIGSSRASRHFRATAARLKPYTIFCQSLRRRWAAPTFWAQVSKLHLFPSAVLVRLPSVGFKFNRHCWMQRRWLCKQSPRL